MLWKMQLQCIAFCYLIASMTSNALFLNKRATVVNETCGEYYDRKDEGAGICRKNGYEEYKPRDYPCYGSGDEPCTAAQCCHNDGDVETCEEYFDRKDDGTGVCERNGYTNAKPGETVCFGGEQEDEPCTAKQCCDNNTRNETCGEYYDRKDEGTGICRENGYDEYKPKDTECNGDCTAAQCCHDDGDVETCGEYFDRKDEGSGICEKNGYDYAKPEDTICEGGEQDDKPCTAAQCCYNKDDTEDTCKNYFNREGNDICDRDGFDTQRNEDVQCGDKNKCTSVTCCKGMEKCKAYFLTYTTEICKAHNQNGPKDSNTQCTTYDGTCIMEDCCKRPA